MLGIFIGILPAIISIRYWFLEYGSIWYGLGPFLFIFGVNIVEKLQSERVLFEKSFFDRPAVVGPVMMCMFYGTTAGHWLESFFWGAVVTALLSLVSINLYRQSA